MHAIAGSRRWSALLAAVVCLAASTAAGSPRTNQANPETLPVTLTGPQGQMAPGAVALLTVAAGEDLAEIAGDLSGAPIRFWQGATAREWHALIGIALDTKPGVVVADVRVRSVAGTPGSNRLFITVARKQFATRRLRVDPKLASPPPEEAARIAEEARLMAEAFAVVTPERLWNGRFDAPVPGTATSSFGRLTITNGRPSGRHQGADFRAAVGTEVRAPNRGRVVLARNLYFAGNTVIVDHGLGVYSLVAHLSRIDVAAGDIVVRGARLGASGATGRVTGPHLHWAVRFGETSVDPLGLMAAVASFADTAAPLDAQ